VRKTCKISGREPGGVVREKEEKNDGRARDVRMMTAGFTQNAVDGEGRGRKDLGVVGVEGILSSDCETFPEP